MFYICRMISFVMLISPFQLTTTSSIGNLTQSFHTLAICFSGIFLNRGLRTNVMNQINRPSSRKDQTISNAMQVSSATMFDYYDSGLVGIQQRRAIQRDISVKLNTVFDFCQHLTSDQRHNWLQNGCKKSGADTVTSCQERSRSPR